MRRWRTFAPQAIDGSPIAVTSCGPINHLRPGMLSFAESDYVERLTITDRPSVLYCAVYDAPRVQECGHVALGVSDPRAAFWATFNRIAATVGPERPVRVGHIAPSAQIGSRAFKVAAGQLVPNIGSVVIEDDVTIGEFTAVDSGIYGEHTEIHAGAHIDNLVHVAHSVIVGPGATVVAHSVLGGWAEIGARAWIGIGAMIKDSVKVGADAIVGMGAVVIRDVPERAVVVGNPARVLRVRGPEECE